LENCSKCSEKDCFECKENYKLIGNKCLLSTNNYLAFPPKLNYQPLLALNLDNLNLGKLNMLTITIWIKYMSPIQLATSDCVNIIYFSLDRKSFLCHNSNDNSIKLFEKGKLAFNFYNANSIFGLWSLFSLSYYSNFNNDFSLLPDSNTNKYFLNNPNFTNKFNFYVNDIFVDLDDSFSKNILNGITKMDNNLDAPYSINFNNIEIGNEFFGYLSEINLYNNYILNPFAITNNSGINMNSYLIKSFNFRSILNSSTDSNIEQCLKNSDVNLNLYPLNSQNQKNYVLTTLGLDCKMDYNPFDSKNLICNRLTFANYRLYGKINNSLEINCTGCNKLCSTGCVNENLEGCFCDFGSAKSYLSLNSLSKRPFCESLTQFDFSIFSNIILPNINASKNNEYSLEFYFYLYTYGYDPNIVNYNNPFRKIEIIWDLHLRILIENINNEIYYICNPIYDSDNKELTELNNQKIKISNPLMNWNYIRCSTNLKKMEYYVGETNFKLNFGATYNIPNLANIKYTTLRIQPEQNSKTNYGFLFLKELKLWSIDINKKLSTNCM